MRFASHTNRCGSKVSPSVTYGFVLTLYFQQVRGHQRAPSDSKEFHEVTKRDALRLLEHDVDRLLETTEKARQPALKAEMGRFADLFGRFIQEGESLLNMHLIFVLITTSYFRGSRIGLEQDSEAA